MVHGRVVLILSGTLVLALAGCSSAGPALGPATVPIGSAAVPATPVPATTAAATAVAATAEPSNGLPSTGLPSSGLPSTPSSAAVAAQTTTPAEATPPLPATLSVPSLPVWTPPADAVAVPAPTGPSAVGIAASGFADTVVFYPAVAGTGRGMHRYVDPLSAATAGLDPTQMDRVVSTAQIDATPAPTDSPRPLVLLTPGWRSIIAFSTSLAQDLASHGYVVLATQTDVAAEWSHPKSTEDDRNKRLVLVEHLLDYVETPALPAIVGPIDVNRIAVGGHSYAGTVAIDASVHDKRIVSAFDIDGSAHGEVVHPPPARPTLVLVTIADGVVSDPQLGGFAARSPQIVSVGVVDALHLDVTDAGSIPSVLGTSAFSTLVGAVGPTGTSDASAIVRRFLDATLGTVERLPTSAELVQGLPSTTADPFGSGAGG